MNVRSLRFQLVVWYAVLLTAGTGLLGVGTYFVMARSLMGALGETQTRRARQIGQLLGEAIASGHAARVGEEIEARYAPGQNNRLVRITKEGGALLYRSEAPRDLAFAPAVVPMPAWPRGEETVRETPLPAGGTVLIAARVVLAPDGTRCLVEAGAPTDDVQANLNRWIGVLVAMLLPVNLSALGGGWWLVKRALSPVDKITASAERITTHNLSDRLPVPPTGDEIERLSLAVNRMIERLEHSFQHSRRFVADASHELRTPLTVLRGELEGLLGEPGLAPEWRDRLGSALEEVERLGNIVAGLFAISRLDAGEAAAEWVKFDLAQLAASTADQMTLLAEDKKITLTCNGVLGVWMEGDRARIKQVVVNLLDNAIKYTPQGGAVILSVEAQDLKARLEVADNGIGIPPEALPRVFDRFFRVDKARSREQGGAGLGLSIVQSICAAHHGRVEATSAPGQGSKFRVEFPLCASAPNHPDHSADHEAGS